MSEAALPLSLQGDDGDRIERFFTHWLGPPSGIAERVEMPVAVDLPEALRRHYQTRARWGVPHNRVCRLLEPSDVGSSEVEPPEVTVVLEEEQGVQEWGFDAELQVWTREVEDGEPWLPVGADLATFLLGYELAEAAMGTLPSAAAASCAWMARHEADDVVAPLAALPVPPFMVGFAPHHLYGNDDVVALVGPNPAGDETPETATGWEVWVSGRCAGSLDWLVELENTAWDVLRLM